MRTPDALEALITDIARRFAYGVLEAVCAASLTELVEARTDRTGSREASRAPAVPGRGGKRGRRSVRRNAAAIARVVRRDAGTVGMQAGDVRAALGFTRAVFQAASRRAVETSSVRREGTKSGARYFAA